VKKNSSKSQSIFGEISWQWYGHKQVN